MIVLRDPLGRPIERLYFEAEELDEHCEQMAPSPWNLRRHERILLLVTCVLAPEHSPLEAGQLFARDGRTPRISSIHGEIR